MEIYPIPNKKAETTTNWLWRELVPHFGKPHHIRLDQGNESKREFSELCEAIEITIRPASARYPCSNG